MNFDLTKILQSKRAYRQRLTALPIEEKLAMLDVLRQRALAIRPTQSISNASVLREEPPSFRIENKKPE